MLPDDKYTHEWTLELPKLTRPSFEHRNLCVQIRRSSAGNYHAVLVDLEEFCGKGTAQVLAIEDLANELERVAAEIRRASSFEALRAACACKAWKHPDRPSWDAHEPPHPGSARCVLLTGHDGAHEPHARGRKPSYSRWSNSNWYTYWNTNTVGDDARLAMWYWQPKLHWSATYAQLRDIDVARLTTLVPGAPDDDVPELLEYVREFCADVVADR